MKHTKKIYIFFLLLSILPFSYYAYAAVEDEEDVITGNETLLPSPFKGDITTIPDLLSFVINEIIVPVGALVAAFFIIYAGFLLVTARGDTGKIKDAKQMLTGAIIGTIILLGAWSIAKVFQGTICSIVGDIEACSEENIL